MQFVLIYQDVNLLLSSPEDIHLAHVIDTFKLGFDGFIGQVIGLPLFHIFSHHSQGHYGLIRRIKTLDHRFIDIRGQVTTDIADPPAWQKQPVADQLWLSQPTFVSPASRELQEETYPGITSRRYEGALDRVYDAVIKVAAANRIKFDKDKLAKGQSQKAKPAPSRTPQSGAGANGAASSASNPAVNPPATDAAPPVPDVVPIPLPRPSPALASLLPQAQAKGDLSLQGSMRTFILGLPFDVVIRLREEEQTVLVDMRVASRYGSHDLGLSAGIAQSYLRALDAELLGIAPE